MPLQTGQWTVNLNGSLGPLTIAGVDQSGNVTGSLLVSANAITGFWDEPSQKISFQVGNGFQLFTGFLFQDQFRMPGISGSTVFTLAGHFSDFSGDFGGSTDRPVFGWYAQIGAV